MKLEIIIIIQSWASKRTNNTLINTELGQLGFLR